MASIADLFGRLLLDDTGFEAEVQKSAGRAGEAASKTMGGKFSSGFKKAIGGAALGAAFVGAVESATKFEDQLRTINTVAKVSDEQLGKIGDDIQQLSRDTGKTTDDLTAGFYDLVSAGVPAGEAIKVLRDSAVLATGALGSTAESVDLVTSALGAYNLGADQSARVTDIFAQAVADGKTTVADLAGGISQVAPIAASAGVSLEEVAAATAIMTLKGDTASQAMTRIKNAISALLTPNATLAKITERTGINFAELAKDKGLAVALEELRKATKGNNEEFAKALGSSEALTLAFSVTGDNAGAMADELAKVEQGADKGGVALEQYTEKSKSATGQGKRLLANVQTFIQDVGGPFVNSVGPAVFALNQFGGAFGRGGVLAKAFGAVLGGLSTKAMPGVKFFFKNVALGGAAVFATVLDGAIAGKDILGSVLGKAWRKLAGSAAVTAAVGVASGAASTAYAAGAKIAGALTDVLTAAWGATGDKVLEAAGVQGLAAGGAFAKAASVAATAAFIATPIVIGLSVAWFLESINPMADKDTYQQVKDAAVQEIKDNIASGKSKPWFSAPIPMDVPVDATPIIGTRDGDLRGTQQKIVEKFGDAMTSAWKRSAAFAALAKAAGNRAAGAWADGIRDRRSEADSAWQDMLDGLKHPMSVTAETAKLFGRLTSKKLAEGLHSADPEVRDRAKAIKQGILDDLAELKPRVGTLTKGAMANLKRAMNNADPDIRTAARAIYRSIHDPIKPATTNATAWGKAIGRGLINGMNAMARAVGVAAGHLANTIADYLATHSPSKLGPLSEMGGPEGMGRNIGALLSKGLASSMPNLGGIGAFQMPSMSLAGAVPAMGGLPPTGAFASIAAGPSSSAGDSFHLSVLAAEPVQRPIDIVRELRIKSGQGYFQRRKS